MFLAGLLTGLLIGALGGIAARASKRREHIRRYTDVLMTRLNRLMYMYEYRTDMGVERFFDQLEEATKEFADALGDFSDGIKELL